MKRFILPALIAALVAAGSPTALAISFNLGGGENYAVLYEGYGGHTLQITNVTINGNVGVGKIGKATDSGPSTVNGRIDFSGANAAGKFSNNNASNVISGGVNFNVAAVTSALSWVNALSQSILAVAGTPIAINGLQTINAASGVLATINGQSVRVFDATSFNNNGTSDVLTISGSASDLVAINLDGLGNIQFHGGIVFSGGITADSVIFNIGGGNYTTLSGGASLDINNNGGVAGVARGIFLDPNGTIQVTNALVQGRIFGGDSNDMQIVSGTNLTAPLVVPDTGSTLVFMGLGVAVLIAAKKYFDSGADWA